MHVEPQQAPPETPSPPVTQGPQAGPLAEHSMQTRSILVVPESLKTVLESADGLISRIGLVPEKEHHLRSTLTASTGLAGATDPAEVALLSALLRASPEVKKLTEWASTVRPQAGSAPLHAASFALLGAVYFFSRLVTYDAALASRLLDASPGAPRGGKEILAGLRSFLSALAREKQSLLGSLALGEKQDKNSVTQMHLLAGILAPFFAELSSSERSKPTSTIGSLFARFAKDKTPEHLKDLGLLDEVRQSHADIIVELATHCAQAQTIEAQQAEELKRQQREKAEAEEATKKEAEKVAELNRTRDVRLKKLNQAIRRVCLSANHHDKNPANPAAITSESAVSTIYELIGEAPETNDGTIYALLEKCPRGARVLLKGAHARLVSDISTYKAKHGGQTWGQSATDNAATGMLWLALEKCVRVSDASRFETLLPHLIKFADENRECENGTVYKVEYCTDIRNALLRLHERKCTELLPA